MTKSTRSFLMWGAIILVIVIGLGALTSGFTSFNPDDIAQKFEKQRNPDNLIMMDVISLKSGKSTKSDVRYDVDENGIVTLNGTASAQEDLIYAKVVLSEGNYVFTAAPESSNKTYIVGLRKTGTSGTPEFRSDIGVFNVSASATYDIVIRVMAVSRSIIEVLCPNSVFW